MNRRALQIFSLNCASANFSEYWEDRSKQVEAVVDLIAKTAADVVCLQESVLEPHSLTHLGYSTGNTARCTTHAGECLIFSSLPIVSAFNTDSDRYSNTYAFPILEIDVSSLGGVGVKDATADAEEAVENNPYTVCVCCVHLSPMGGNAAQRQEQVKRIAVAMLEHRNPSAKMGFEVDSPENFRTPPPEPEPVAVDVNDPALHNLIVVGDTNMRFNEDLLSIGLQDGFLAWRAATRGSRPPHIVEDGIPTIPADFPGEYYSDVEAMGWMYDQTAMDSNTEEEKKLCGERCLLVDGHTVPVSWLLDNAGLQEAINEPIAATIQPHFCRMHRTSGFFPDHDHATCNMIHLKNEALPPPPMAADEEFTWDSYIDKFNGLDSPAYRTRYDRICFHPAGPVASVANFGLIANTAVDPKDPRSFLSDHFGFVTGLDLSNC